MTHPTDRLAEYAAGAVALDVSAHLSECVTCRAELASWQRLRDAERADSTVVAGPAPLTGVLNRIRASAPVTVPRYAPADRSRRLLLQLGQLLAHQARLIRLPVWILAALAVAGGTVLAAVAPAGRAGEIFALVVPPVALGAMMYGRRVGSVVTPGGGVMRSSV